MRWTPGGNSDDVEDRRDDSGSGGMQLGGVHLGVGGLIIVFVLSLLFHRNFFALLGVVQAGRQRRSLNRISPRELKPIGLKTSQRSPRFSS
jgi:predicted metalloprotease